MKRQHYQALDIETDASPEDIKKAYRYKAKETHPDKNDGDDKGFVSVNLAYEVLSDPDRRAKYDQTGDDKVFDEKQEARNIIVGLSMTFVDSVQNTKTNSLVDFVRKKINENISNYNNTIKNMTSDSEKTKDVIERIKVKEGIENPIRDIMSNRLEQIQNAIRENERILGFFKLALVEIERYSYLTDAKDTNVPMSTMGGFEHLPWFIKSGL